MVGILGILGNSANIDLNYLIETIDQLHSCKNDIVYINNFGKLVISSNENTPIKGEKHFENDEWIIIFSGDLVNYDYVPYNEIISILDNNQFELLENYIGIFSIIAYYKKQKILYIISDRLSIYPIFYLINEQSIYFSSKLSTFCRLPITSSFNIQWLLEYLFFNYPIGNDTFLEKVKRIPASSVLEIEIESKKHRIFEYAPKFKKEKELLNGKEGLKYSLKIFSDKIKDYYVDDYPTKCSLTGGWDARTILAFSPNKNISTYTYGIDGCSDLINASITADTLGLHHEKIFFDEEFIDNLPKYMLETVFLSSGLQGILRSSLLHVYKKLDDNSNSPIFLSGIFFDNIFRGHMNSPAQISEQMMNLMKTEKYSNKLLKDILTDYNFQSDIIPNKIASLSKYGNFKSNEFHLSYQIYETLKNYFGGEVSLANEFGTIRIPAINPEIIKLAYKSKFSALEFSEYGGHKRGIKENILQAYLISQKNLDLSQVPVNGLIPPKIILKGNLYFILYWNYKRIINFVFRKLKSQKISPPLEDWDYWLNDVHKEFINDLIFSPNSKIHEYFEEEFLENLKDKRTLEWIGKLATIEIILRLIDNNWEKFW